MNARTPVPFLTLSALVLSTLGCGTPPPTDFCTNRRPGDLVLSELMMDPEGTDTGSEWVELFNNLDAPVDLRGVQLYVAKVDRSGLKSHTLRAGNVGAHGYFTLGDVRSGPNPAWVSYSYDDALGSLPQAEGLVGLRCDGVVLDEVTYTRAAKSGRSRMVGGAADPDATANDDEAAWCDTAQSLSFSGTNAGTPGEPNGLCEPEIAADTCAEYGFSRAIVFPRPGDLIVTEIMADPKAAPDTAAEWIEFAAMRDVDLNNLVLSVGSSRTKVTSAACLRLNSGQFGLLARSADPTTNGGLPAPAATFTASLANTELLVSLSAADAGIDTATIPAAVNGVAWQLPVSAFASPSTLAAANDSPASFCPASTRYGDADAGDFGTPGWMNGACALPASTSCFDVARQETRLLVTPGPGDLVITELLADPKAVSDTVGEWVELLATRDVDLNNVVLSVGGNHGAVASSTCLRLVAGQFGVLARSADPLVNGGLAPPLATLTTSLTNGALVVALSAADAGIDTAQLPAAVPGVAWQLPAAAFASPSNLPSANDAPAGFCLASTRYGPPDAGDFGTPGAMNLACEVASTATCFDVAQGATRPLVTPVVGDLAITEFMADPSAVTDTAGEWIEVRANTALDLNGLLLGNESATRTALLSPDCLALSGGGYAVFARSADAGANGGLPPLLGTFSFSLANATGRAVVVELPDGGLLDRLGYEASTPGASTQLSAGLSAPGDNDVSLNLCATPAGRTYGAGDRGTPGAANASCQ